MISAVGVRRSEIDPTYERLRIGHSVKQSATEVLGFCAQSCHERGKRIAAVTCVAMRNTIMRHIILICVSVLALMPTVRAEKPVGKFGVLTCTSVKPAHDVVHRMTCGFKPEGTRAEEKYSGIIRDSSQDLPSGKIVLIWTVLGPIEGRMRAGVLAQVYLKAIGAGGQTSVLVGETDPSIALHFETNDGGAAYEAITRMELELTGTSA
jgi:hypothetical protein